MKSTILIVDDIKKNLELLASVLYENSYNILIASGGHKAIEIAEKKIPDLILLDIMMPEMNGYEVCQELKENPKTKNIPVIFLTARSEEYAIVEAFEVGGVDYISKPFNQSELLARVATHLKINQQTKIIRQQQDELLKHNKELEDVNHSLEVSNRQIIESTQKIIEKEREFGSIFYNIKDVFYRTTLKGELKLLSPSGKKIWGTDDLEILKEKNVAETLIFPKEREEMLEILLRDGKVKDFVLHLKTFDNKKIIVEANSYLVFDPETNLPVAIEGILRDVTERRHYQEILEENEKRLEAIFENVQSGIVLVDADTFNIVEANPAATKILGNVEQIIGTSCKALCAIPGYENQPCPMLTETEKIENVECVLINKYDEKIPIVKSVTEINLKNKKFYLETFVDISKQKEMQKMLKEKSEKIEEQNKEIIASINYAYRIQNALLPSEDFLKNYLPENFILFKPKDIISGDFYWAKQLNNTLFLAVADCTGHGVPGAFISTIAITLLNEIVGRRFILETDEILNELRKQVILMLHQDYITKKTIHDGLDIAICSIDLYDYKLSYSGAHNPLIIIRENKENKFELQEIKADKMPISSFIRLNPFKKHHIQLNEDDRLYLFSDGYVDQIGELSQKKFYKKKFKEILLQNSHLSMQKQRKILEDAFYLWKGNFMQIDDVTIIGIKISVNFGDVDLF